MGISPKSFLLPTPAWAKKLLGFMLFLMMTVQPTIHAAPFSEETKAWLSWGLPIVLSGIGWWAGTRVDKAYVDSLRDEK